MKNNKGITLIALAITILLLFVLAGFIISTSINSIEQMRFSNLKSELEEIQKKVNEISSDFDLYKKSNTDATYKEYFEYKFGNSPLYLKDVKSSLNDLLEAKEVLKYKSESENLFYFNRKELKTYMGLKISRVDSIVIDFDTRNVYTANGFKDPNDKNKICYCMADLDASTAVPEKSAATKWELELEAILSTDFINRKYSSRLYWKKGNDKSII